MRIGFIYIRYVPSYVGRQVCMYSRVLGNKRGTLNNSLTLEMITGNVSNSGGTGYWRLVTQVCTYCVCMYVCIYG